MILRAPAKWPSCWISLKRALTTAENFSLASLIWEPYVNAQSRSLANVSSQSWWQRLLSRKRLFGEHLCCCVPRVPLVPHTSHPPLLHLGRSATDVYTFLSNLIVDDKLNLSVLKFFAQIELIFDWTAYIFNPEFPHLGGGLADSRKEARWVERPSTWICDRFSWYHGWGTKREYCNL